MHFLGNLGVYPDHNLGTFGYLHQGSKIFHVKSHLNTLVIHENFA